MYKIGISKHPVKRINEIQTGNSEKLKLVEVYQSENALKIEKTLHNMYGYCRFNGEWFNFGIAEEFNFIKNCRTIDNNINALKELGNNFI